MNQWMKYAHSSYDSTHIWDCMQNSDSYEYDNIISVLIWKGKIFLLINNLLLLLYPKSPLERKNLHRIMEYVEFMWRIYGSAIPLDSSLLVETRPWDSGDSDQISFVVCFPALPFGVIMLIFVVRNYKK